MYRLSNYSELMTYCNVNYFFDNHFMSVIYMYIFINLFVVTLLFLSFL